MSLPPGSRIGPYEVAAPLGAGGMGEVYRARDTKLHRDVALKVLPDAFAADGARLVRFEREAQLLAALNHPHIAQIYGLESQAIVMELVEGETLADRLERGPIALAETLAIARQIADALEAAHGGAIVHRDLKPANVKVAPSGTVKVLDFGLAKAVEAVHGTSGTVEQQSLTPTITSPVMTSAGTILGTAAYMSPEQARAKPVDRRTDVWSFGCVVYEMLTGRRTFEASGSVSDAIAAILTREPDWSALPGDTPERIRLLLRRCLQKDPQKRLRDLGDACLEIDEALAEGPAPAARTQPIAVTQLHRSRWRRVTSLMLAAIGSGVVAGILSWSFKPVPAQPVTRMAIPLPDGQRFTTTNRQIVAISPDGATLAYIANGALHLRSLAELEARTIPGTETVSGIAYPTFSPDGSSVAFWSLGDRVVKRVSVAGGAPVPVTTTKNFLFFGMSWDESGIAWGEGTQGIWRVGAAGGQPQQLVKVEDNELAHGPQILPGGQSVLFTLANGTSSDRWDRARVVVQSLRSGERKTIVQGGSDARYLSTGHLVYAVGGTLFAVRFDPGRLEVSGTAAPVLEGVRRSLGGVTGTAQFSVSNTGSLVYVPGSASTAANQDLAIIDRAGKATPLKFAPDTYEHPRVSPDGRRVVFATDNGKDAIVYVYDLAGTSVMRRLTFSGRNRFPIWSADGRDIAFQSDRDGDLGIFRQPANGSGAAERLTKADPGTSHVPESWSRDENLVFDVLESPTKVSLRVLSVRDGKTALVEGVEGPAGSGALTNATFSPDGKWLAWSSSGGVFAQPFPTRGVRYQITLDRGIYPLWSRDGRELYFTPPGELHAVSVTTNPTFETGRPVSLPRGFLVNGTGTPRSYDILPDGRFIGVIDPQLSVGNAVAQPVLVLNWTSELQRMVPTR